MGFRIAVSSSGRNQSDEIVPHFALPTTSNVIRSTAESPEKAKIILTAHNEFIKKLRSNTLWIELINLLLIDWWFERLIGQRAAELRRIIRERKQQANQPSSNNELEIHRIEVKQTI